MRTDSSTRESWPETAALTASGVKRARYSSETAAASCSQTCLGIWFNVRFSNTEAADDAHTCKSTEGGGGCGKADCAIDVVSVRSAGSAAANRAASASVGLATSRASRTYGEWSLNTGIVGTISSRLISSSVLTLIMNIQSSG